MKRTIFIITLNIIFFIFIIFLIEFISYKRLLKIYPIENSKFKFLNFYKQDNPDNDLSERLEPSTPYTEYKFKYFDQNYTNTPPTHKKNTQAIIVFGCSMAYGVELNENQTFSYKISKELKRPVYNFAYPAGGLNQIYYILKNNKFKNAINKEPEYILYFYNPDHIRRMVMRCTPTNKPFPGVFYKLSHQNLLLKQNRILENSYLYSLLTHNHTIFCIDNYCAELEKLFSAYLSSINKEIKTLFPNSKFVIIKFSSLFDFENNVLRNYNVIDIPELTKINVMNENTQKQWCIDDGFHPNEKYWDKVIPVIINELQKL